MTVLGKDIYVIAYPKSGITWLIRLLSDVLSSPVYDQSTGEYVWWGGKEGGYIIHNRHEYYQPELHDGKIIVFLQRDPRDIVISAWFYRGHKIPLEQSMRTMWQGKTYVSWVGSWSGLATVYEWTTCTRYEWLIKYAAIELQSIARQIVGGYLDIEKCQQAIENHSFKNMLAQMNDPHFMRKGIVGDWKNHFTREIAKEFNDHLGKFMLERGYVDNLDWWKEL